MYVYCTTTCTLCIHTCENQNIARVGPARWRVCYDDSAKGEKRTKSGKKLTFAGVYTRADSWLRDAPRRIWNFWVPGNNGRDGFHFGTTTMTIVWKRNALWAIRVGHIWIIRGRSSSRIEIFRKKINNNSYTEKALFNLQKLIFFPLIIYIIRARSSYNITNTHIIIYIYVRSMKIPVLYGVQSKWVQHNNIHMRVLHTPTVVQTIFQLLLL